MHISQLFTLRKYNFGIISSLRVVWVIVILWYELGTFYHHVVQCAWPDEFSVTSTLNDVPTPTHVLLVADPQVLDHRSYPGRTPLLVYISQLMVDLNMRKSWWATKQLHPDVVFFLGDMMDGGRFAMDDDEYESYYRRFESIFYTEDIPVYYIPGNHDVGLGSSSGFSDQADERYISHFGLLKQRLEVANHTFILIDAPSLVEEDYARSTEGITYTRWAATHPDGVINFIQHTAVMTDAWQKPTVLLTHIPLARPPTASCGPLREKGTIRAGAGYGYENTLSAQASQFLLQNVRPSIVFGGDDHDYCEYTHTLPAFDDVPNSAPRDVKEVTVKSFSMAMGVRRPGFQLLSLLPTPLHTNKTLDDAPCILPDQLDIYLYVYVPLVILSLFVLFIANARRDYTGSTKTRASQQLSTASPPNGTSTTGHKLGMLSLPVRRFEENDSDDEHGFILPPPTPSSAVAGKNKNKNNHARRLKLTLGGWTLDVPTLPCLARTRHSQAVAKGRRRGVLGGFAHDVLSVAWMPVGLFVAIAWWMFQ